MWLLFGREAWIAHDSEPRWILCLTGKIRLKLLPDERCVRDSMKHRRKLQKLIVSKLFSTAMYFQCDVYGVDVFWNRPLLNLLRPKRQLCVAFARCEGGRLAPLCPFREPMGIFDEAPSLPWQMLEGKGWEVCASFTWSLQELWDVSTLIQYLHSHNPHFVGVFQRRQSLSVRWDPWVRLVVHSSPFVSILSAMWTSSPRSCSKGSGFAVPSAEPNSEGFYRFLPAAGWNTFLSYTGPHHEHMSVGNSACSSHLHAVRSRTSRLVGIARRAESKVTYTSLLSGCSFRWLV